jgi:hypothetical protein
MPSSQHEALVQVFRQRPAFAADLLHNALGIKLPNYLAATLRPADLTSLTPTELRADGVIRFHRGNPEEPVHAVVVEVQLGRDDGKRTSWPAYVTNARVQLRCPVTLLVVCTNVATKMWCETAIETGHPGFVLRPLVVGPDRVPLVTDAKRAAASPDLAVLSAAAHATSRDRDRILQALVDGLARIDQDQAAEYAQIVLAALPKAARSHWEKLMSVQFDVPYQTKFFRNAQARAEAEAVLEVLDERGIDVPDDARTRILQCTDRGQLTAWLRSAVHADTIEDLFE